MAGRMAGAHRAYLGLGSNLGDRLANLRAGLEEMERQAGPACTSLVYETNPVGIMDQPAFFNAVCRIETHLSPDDLLGAMLATESARGRVRSVRGGPRTLDLDLLLYDDLIVDEPGLIIPHPRMHERAFVLVPLAEIAPHVLDPVSGLSAQQMLDRLPRPLGVGRAFTLRD